MLFFGMLTQGFTSNENKEGNKVPIMISEEDKQICTFSLSLKSLQVLSPYYGYVSNIYDFNEEKKCSPSGFLISHFCIELFAWRILWQAGRITRKWFCRKELENINQKIRKRKVSSTTLPRITITNCHMKIALKNG